MAKIMLHRAGGMDLRLNPRTYYIINKAQSLFRLPLCIHITSSFLIQDPHQDTNCILSTKVQHQCGFPFACSCKGCSHFRLPIAAPFAITHFSEVDSYLCIVVILSCHSLYSFLELSNLLKHVLICIY